VEWEGCAATPPPALFAQPSSTFELARRAGQAKAPALVGHRQHEVVCLLRSDISIDDCDGHQVERFVGGYVLKPRVSYGFLVVGEPPRLGELSPFLD
jgi:hypothetical protein